MTIEQAAEKAISAGMDRGEWSNTNGLLLKLIFWQSLGKALGWKCPKESHKAEFCGKAWLFYWHNFIDHLAEGKTAESFFETLS